MRLIDADALLHKMKRTYRYCGIKFDVEEMPTIDAAPVVRCKDCKFWENGDCYRLELSRPDDFCSYGERRECNE